MIDIHSAETDPMGHTANLWYTDTVSTKDYYKSSKLTAYRNRTDDTIPATGLKNEPHRKPGVISYAVWNNTKNKNNWRYAAQTAALKVLKKNPNLPIVIEGGEAIIEK